ncbi:MAG: hypothetical protein IJ668_06860 [Selenomonadaceae bacterium]|nr:hypothetical protein [Selenomonadaceae bacterium]
MVEKIERVARVKGIDNDVSKRFSRKDGRNSGGNRKNFESTLNAAVKRRAELEARPAAGDVDTFEIRTFSTHSLFYRVNSLDELLAYAN